MFVFLSILAGIFSALAFRFYKKASLRKLFFERDFLSESQIFDFYRDENFDKEKVLFLWKEVAEILNLPYGSLRPSDRFGRELNGSWLVDNEIDEISDIALNRLAKYGVYENLEKIASLDDYIRKFAPILRNEKHD